MPDADADATTTTTTTQPPKEKEKEAHILQQITFRNPPWTYFHLTLVISPCSFSSSTSDLSPLVLSPLLTSALRAYLGTTGAAIPIDILKTAGCNVWIRVPRQDARGLRAALSSWAGSVEGADVGFGVRGRVGVAWKVGAQSGVLGLLGGGGVGMGDGRDVFG